MSPSNISARFVCGDELSRKREAHCRQPILQNEYSTWIIKDKHSRAYQALTEDVGERMAHILKLGAKAEEAPKCLAATR